MNPKELIKKYWPYAAIALVAYLIFRLAVRSVKKSIADPDEIIPPSRLTYPIVQYQGMAEIIEGAMKVWGSYQTDEAAIFDQIRKIRSLDDLKALDQAWGSRRLQNFYGFGDDFTLAQALRYELDTKEIETVNQILAQNNINFTF